MRKIIYSFLLLISSLLSEDTIKIIWDKNLTKVYEIECINLMQNGTPSVSMETNGTTLDLDISTNQSTAIHIIIDTSKSMGYSYSKGIKPFLKKLIPILEKRKQTILLSTFSKNMALVYHTGDNNLSKVLSKIRIKGRTTELYRNTKNALMLLSKESKKRKILMLLSDGDAEDTQAYTSNDVIVTAKKMNIRIATLGYKDKGTVLQNLRKLSEETYGKFWIADKKYRISSTFLREFLSMLDSQFGVQIPKTLLKPNETGSQIIKMNFSKNNKSETIEIKLPTQKINIKDISFWDRYKLYILIAFCLFLFLFLFLLLRPNKNKQNIEENHIHISMPNHSDVLPSSVPVPIAFLEPMGGDKHPIYQFPATVGKKSTNDVVINGKYISRNHAVIDLKDGSFSITDRDSANGTKVNSEKLTGTINIVPGDKIEFGPYKTVFILN